MKINCPNCSENFKAMAAFQDHCQSVHGQDKDQIAIKCKHCKKTFESANACSKHIKIEHSHKCTFKSDIDKSQCLKAFPTQMDLRTHLFTAHNAQSIECEFCDKTFLEPRYHESHVKSVHKGLNKKPCDICHETFANNTILNSHRIKCAGTKSEECQYCKKHFLTERQLKSHITQEHKEKKYSKLPETITLDLSLEAKVKRNIKITDCFQCGLCKKFIHLEEDKMSDHVRQHFINTEDEENVDQNEPVHEQPKDIETPENGSSVKSGQNKKVETVHQNASTSAKPSPSNDSTKKLEAEKQFKCKHCEKMFQDPAALQTHIKSTHNEIPKIAINQKNTNNLKKMVASKVKDVINEKPMNSEPKKSNSNVKNTVKVFRCQICEKSFKEKASLISHYQKVHKKVINTKKTSISNESDKNVPKEGTGNSVQKESTLLIENTKSQNLTAKSADDNSNAKGNNFSNVQYYNETAKKKSMPFACKHCSKIFDQLSELKTHDQIHKKPGPVANQNQIPVTQNVPEKTLCNCKVCGKTFIQLDELKNHHQIHKLL